MAKKQPEAEAQAKAPGTEVTEAKATEMQTMFVADSQGGATGFEEADSNAFAIPFLQILQSGSPQCKRSDGAYIKDAHEGMFFNTVTQATIEGEDITDKNSGEITKGGLRLIPCHYTQRFIEWKPRDSGGGFVAEHKPTDPIALSTVKDEENRDVLPNGNILVDTRNHYVLILGENGVYEPCVISMSSTQLKKSRNWMSKMQQLKVKSGSKFIPAPMASHVYRVSTVPESNDKGSWYGWKIEMVEQVMDTSLYQAAQDFRSAIIKGNAKSAPPNSPGDEVPATEKF